jgi:hypothetical protein
MGALISFCCPGLSCRAISGALLGLLYLSQRLLKRHYRPTQQSQEHTGYFSQMSVLSCPSWSVPLSALIPPRWSFSDANWKATRASAGCRQGHNAGRCVSESDGHWTTAGIRHLSRPRYNQLGKESFLSFAHSVQPAWGTIIMPGSLTSFLLSGNDPRSFTSQRSRHCLPSLPTASTRMQRVSGSLASVCPRLLESGNNNKKGAVGLTLRDPGPFSKSLFHLVGCLQGSRTPAQS